MDRLTLFGLFAVVSTASSPLRLEVLSCGKTYVGGLTVTKLEELETVIASLPEEEYRQFRRWFLEADWEKWDREIEEDSRAGRLDFLVEEALQAKRKGTLRDL